MKTLVCHGDSLTEGKDLDRGAAWPALVGHLCGLKIVNCGIGGDTTGGLLARFYPDVIARKPDFVLLLGGTNDLWWGVQTPQVMANLFAMVCQARYHGITPLIATPLPMDASVAQQAGFSPPPDGFKGCVRRIGELSVQLLAAARDDEIVGIDLFGPFMAENEAADVTCFLDDGLHLNAHGHRRAAKEIGRHLQTAFLL